MTARTATRVLTCALALAACGCSEDKAKAELDSARAEASRAKEDAARAKVDLELVRHKAEAARLAAIAGKPETKSFLASPLVGKWAFDGSSSRSMEFFADGTFREVAPIGSANGKYTTLDGGRVKLEAEGYLFGSTNMWEYAIAGDRLVMTLEGTPLEMKYTRVK